jgi:DNA-binding XRE family transcriptional regulator
VAFEILLRHFSSVINNRDIELLKAFGSHLRGVRLNKGLSQYELALNAGISKNQVGNIERGEVNITITTAKAICKVLNISLKELFDFEN